MTSHLKLIFSIFIIFLNFAFANQTKFKVSFDPDYAPFSYVNDNNPEGLLIDYWKLWAEKNNYELEFVNGKLWDDAIELARTGEVDFFLGTYPYEDWMRGSLDIYETQTSIFMHKGSNKEFDKNSAYIIGVIGSDYVEYMQENFPNSEIVVYEDYPSIFKDFQEKKLDLIYEDKIAVEFYTLRNEIFHLVHAIEFLNDDPSFQAISKDEKKINLFNEGFKKLEFDELYNIETKWIIDKESRYYENLNTLFFTKEEKEFIEKNIIKVSVSKEWKPFSFMSETNEPTGISSDIWKLISKKAGLKSQYTFYENFTKQLESIKLKTNDIIFSTGKTKDREKYAIFTDPYVKFPISIVTLKDENYIENMDFLKNRTIAVGKNFTAHKMLKEAYPNLKLKLVKNIEDGLRAVDLKTAYAYIDIKPNLTYNISKLGLENIKISGYTSLNFDLRMMIRDDYSLLQSILNKTIKSVDKEEIQAIVDKWNNVQFQNRVDYSKIWIALLIIAFVIIVLIYLNQLNIRRNRILKEKVEERTKELRRVNELLEQKVDYSDKELKKLHYILDEAQKISNLGSFQYNIKNQTLIFSDELYKIFELDKQKVKPSVELVKSFIHDDDKKEVNKLLEKTIFSKNKMTLEFRLLVNKKVKFVQLTSKTTKLDNKKRPLLLIGTLLDLTKIKTLEQEKRERDSILAQQSKMAALGEMLENIAHQWRQPLSIISTASTGIQLKYDFEENVPKETILENVELINKQAQYLSKTIDDFRNFFNPNKKTILFDVDKTIDKALSLIVAKAKTKDVEVKKDLKEIRILGHENELIQVLINLLNNSIDAFDSNFDNLIFIKMNIRENNLVIEINDNAGGIDQKIINRVFEPYFTTKHKSQGTGIGLYMSNEIITKHLKGSIKVSNKQFSYDGNDHFGASFNIILPLKEEMEK